MSFTIVVLIKQVPDAAAGAESALNSDGTLDRGALPAACNPEDMHALEMALAIRDRFAATVTAMTMGPPRAAEVLRGALYMGADRAILLTDRRFAGSDTLATSSVLSQAVRQLGAVDLILCGRQTIDGHTAQVGPQVAEQLGMNQLTYVGGMEHLDAVKCSCWREVETGRELAESKLPVLLTVNASANTPRPFSAKRIMRFKKALAPSERAPGASADALAGSGLRIEQWDADRLGIDSCQCGLAGSPTRVAKIDNAAPACRAFKKIQPDDQGMRELLEELIADHTFD